MSRNQSKLNSNKIIPLFMRIPVVLSIKTLVVLFATIAIFYQDLAILANEALRSEMASYIIAIPFLFVYLLYRKRKMLRAVISLGSADRSKKTNTWQQLLES